MSSRWVLACCCVLTSFFPVFADTNSVLKPNVVPKPALTLYTWEDYMDPLVIEEWYNKTGIPINQVYYDDEAQRNLVLSGHAAKQIDMAIIDSASVFILSQAGHLYPVMQERGREEYWPNACTNYGKAYFWGTYGIVYRKDKLAAPLDSWYDLLHPQEPLRGHIGMLGLSDELLISALLALGYPSDSEEKEHLQAAFNLLKQQSKSVVTYDYLYTYIAANPNDDVVWAAPAYSGDQAGLNDVQGSSNWQYVIPKEGTTVWVDCFVITGGTNRKQEAQAFIDFLSTKEISARNAENVWLASPFYDVRPLLSPEILEDETVYLPDSLINETALFTVQKSTDILKRTRIKDALIRYHDIN